MKHTVENFWSWRQVSALLNPVPKKLSKELRDSMANIFCVFAGKFGEIFRVNDGSSRPNL